MTPEDRFWPKVDKTGECWIWTASRFGEGKRYGQFRYGDRMRPAHRVSWALAHEGRLPGPGLVVCHACDTPLCVRPSHLFLGTQAENLSDMRAKERDAATHLARLGTQNHNARLNPDAVRDARRRHQAGQSVKDIASVYRVTPATIRQAVKRETWKHVA